MDNTELDGVKFSEFPSQTPVNADEVVGLHSGDNARFSIANIVAAVRQGLANIFVPKSDVGATNGVASLDSTGKVPSSQLPPISSDAEDITYDPTTSGASATNVQDALDEAFGDLDGKQSTITASGILKGDGQGGVTAATPGTDYQAPLTAGTDYATPAQLADKANQAQLAYVETGTTASRNYSTGVYVCWNGLLYTANQAISSGTTLSAGTGGNLTECVGGAPNHISGTILSGMKISTFTGTLDRTSATNVYNTGITWTNYAMLSFSMFGATPGGYPWIIDSVSNSGIKALSINNSGTFTIEKTAAHVGGTNRFYITVIHD